MTEVINISQSQRANHITTHLYNIQESHIPYKRSTTVNYNNSTYLTTFKNSNNQTNYSPRALIYDLRQGFGTLNKFEYQEAPSTFDHLSADQIIAKPDYTKNAYQSNLDLGKPTRDLLNVENTKMWSDYNKLIHNPRNLHHLQNYNYSGTSDGVHKNFDNVKFSTYRQGVEEYKNTPDSLDDFRYILEQCDLFHGVNIMTDLDSGWGGFTSEYITELIDEYFNNGNKHNLWTYAIMTKVKPTSTEMISRIKSFIEIGRNSSLFFPIQVPQKSDVLNDFRIDSMWHTSAVLAMFIDSLWSINNQVESLIPMDHIEASVTRGYYDRKYVNEIKINFDELPVDISMVDINAYYAMAEEALKKENYVNLGLHDKNPGTYFSKNHISTTEVTPEQGIPSSVYKLQNESTFRGLDSTPDIFSLSEYNTEFNTSTSFAQTLKTYKKIVSNIRLVVHLEIVEDKHEMVEELDKLVQEYTVGYDSEEEDDD